MKNQENGCIKERLLFVFSIGEQDLAIDISKVRDIIHVSRLVTIPDSPFSMVGMVNVREDVFPVVDLAERIGAPRERNRKECFQEILLVKYGNLAVGCLVDSVSEVIQASHCALAPSNVINPLNVGAVDWVYKFGERLLPFIETEKMFDMEEVEELNHVAKEGLRYFEINCYPEMNCGKDHEMGY